MKETHVNADMSHQNTLIYKIGELKNSIHENGLLPTLSKIWQRVYYKIKGVDFSTQNIFDLTLTGEHQDHGTALVSTSKDFFRMIFEDLESAAKTKIARTKFLDYGSGKGAAIIHARGYGFGETIGVEFAKELHEVAEVNIQKLGLTHVASRYQDATAYLPPLDISVIYLFNPFDAVVMEKVARMIASQKETYQNPVYIIYGNPSCEVLEGYFTLLGKVDYPSGARAHFFKV